LKVFDVMGREVATLVDEAMPPGIYRIQWNPTDLSSGVYFCRLQARQTDGGRAGDASTSSARGLVQMRKALLLK
jgi:hypothetical protein